MTPEQRTAVVGYLEGGATFSESAALAGASMRALSVDWTRGKQDAESGVESGERTFYLEASGARARIRAELRAEAREAAGSREATDKLAVLSALLAEDEPTFADEDNVRARAPFLDVLDHPERYSDETKCLISEAELALRAAFCAWNDERMAVVA